MGNPVPWQSSPLPHHASSTATVERIPHPSGVPLEAVWQEEWHKHLLAAALERVKRQVSARQFQLFDLHVLQQVPVQDAARTLKTSVASIYMAKHRVSRLLKKEIRKLEAIER